MEDEYGLYRVEITTPVETGTYYVIAQSFDAAAKAATDQDNVSGDGNLINGGCRKIEKIGPAELVIDTRTTE